MSFFHITEWVDLLPSSHGIVPPKSLPGYDRKEVDSTRDPLKQDNRVDGSFSETIHSIAISSDDHQETHNIQAKKQCIVDKFNQERLKSTLKPIEFNEIVEIKAFDFAQYVTKASSKHPVVLHIFQTNHPLCDALDYYLIRLARCFPMLTFLKILATECILNYPEKKLPTIHFYKNGALFKRLTEYHHITANGELENILMQLMC